MDCLSPCALPKTTCCNGLGLPWMNALRGAFHLAACPGKILSFRFVGNRPKDKFGAFFVFL
jgi:hypothetical protein